MVGTHTAGAAVILALALGGCGNILKTSVTKLPRNTELEQAVINITAHAGLSLNILVVEDRQRGPGYATMQSGQRYIGIDPAFFSQLTYAEKMALLAHEVAHHLFGLTGTNTNTNYENELTCDRWAGWVLARMGISQWDAMSLWSNNRLAGEAGATHPAAADRVNAANDGHGLATNQESARIQQERYKLNQAQAELSTEQNRRIEAEQSIAILEAETAALSSENTKASVWKRTGQGLSLFGGIGLLAALIAAFVMRNLWEKRRPLDAQAFWKIFDVLFDPMKGSFPDAGKRRKISIAMRDLKDRNSSFEELTQCFYDRFQDRYADRIGVPPAVLHAAAMAMTKALWETRTENGVTRVLAGRSWKRDNRGRSAGASAALKLSVDSISGGALLIVIWCAGIKAISFRRRHERTRKDHRALTQVRKLKFCAQTGGVFGTLNHAAESAEMIVSGISV